MASAKNSPYLISESTIYGKLSCFKSDSSLVFSPEYEATMALILAVMALSKACNLGGCSIFNRGVTLDARNFMSFFIASASKTSSA